MSRYIDANEAIKAYNDAMTELVEEQMKEWELADFSECEFNTTDCLLIARKIEALPSIDIVRCKECKHWRAYETWSECELWTDDPYESAKTKADDFCSYGERQTE